MNLLKNMLGQKLNDFMFNIAGMPFIVNGIGHLINDTNLGLGFEKKSNPASEETSPPLKAICFEV